MTNALDSFISHLSQRFLYATMAAIDQQQAVINMLGIIFISFSSQYGKLIFNFEFCESSINANSGFYSLVRRLYALSSSMSRYFRFFSGGIIYVSFCFRNDFNICGMALTGRLMGWARQCHSDYFSEAFSFAEGQQAGGGTLPPGGAFMPPLSGLLGAPQLGGPSGPQQFPLGGGQFPSQGPPLQASHSCYVYDRIFMVVAL